MGNKLCFSKKVKTKIKIKKTMKFKLCPLANPT